MDTTNTLSGQSVLVVGGARNLGLAIARGVAQQGGTAIIAARDHERARAIASDIPHARATRIDITDEESIRAAAESLGAIDHVVSTVAAHHSAPVSFLDHDLMVRAFEAKVIGPLLLTKHFAPRMDSGSFVFFSGVVSRRPAATRVVTGITNGAVHYLAEHLAAELAPIRVNAISPGIIDSGAWDALQPDAKQGFLKQSAEATLVGRVGTPEDIVAATLWLLTAGFVSGETIHVEGGIRRD